MEFVKPDLKICTIGLPIMQWVACQWAEVKTLEDAVKFFHTWQDYLDGYHIKDHNIEARARITAVVVPLYQILTEKSYQSKIAI